MTTKSRASRITFEFSGGTSVAYVVFTREGKHWSVGAFDASHQVMDAWSAAPRWRPSQEMAKMFLECAERRVRESNCDEHNAENGPVPG